jgi:hypothetical protein
MVDLKQIDKGIAVTSAIIAIDEPEEGLTDPDEVPEPPAEAITQPGDLWIMGDHRLLCGDSTDAESVAYLMDGAKAALVHADPPYGMGKENDGVQNDNLYAEKLDAFQMEWWKAVRPHVEDNGSAYIWGNAPDLWRLWYVGGLNDSERLTMRNFVTWNKYVGNVKPTMIEQQRSYVKYREDCLFFMLGEQGFNNNADNYWDGWEPIRAYLDGELQKLYAEGWTRKRIDVDVFGCTETSGGMVSHYVGTSQWAFITEENYEALQRAAAGKAFLRPYDSKADGLKQDHDRLKQDHDRTEARLLRHACIFQQHTRQHDRRMGLQSCNWHRPPRTRNTEASRYDGESNEVQPPRRWHMYRTVHRLRLHTNRSTVHRAQVLRNGTNASIL